MQLSIHDLKIKVNLLVINLGIIKLIIDLTFTKFSVYNTFSKLFVDTTTTTFLYNLLPKGAMKFTANTRRLLEYVGL